MTDVAALEEFKARPQRRGARLMQAPTQRKGASGKAALGALLLVLLKWYFLIRGHCYAPRSGMRLTRKA